MGRVNNVWKREGECQVDIVDGDNAAEIAGGQRGLMMMLLASERANERIERVARGQGHHCILRFTLCHQFVAPLVSIAPSPLPLFRDSRIIRHSRTPVFRYRVRRRAIASAVAFARELVTLSFINPLYENILFLIEHINDYDNFANIFNLLKLTSHVSCHSRCFKLFN